jgi:hypothetical protein
MSVVRKFRPKLNLTKLMKSPGGMYVNEALKRADQALEAMQEECLSGVDEALDKMEALRKGAPGAALDIETMYTLSSSVIDLCGGITQTGLETAGRSLCDYLDRLGEGERLDLRGVDVHIASMRLLHRSPAPPEARKAILDGLAQVVALQSKPS